MEIETSEADRNSLRAFALEWQYECNMMKALCASNAYALNIKSHGK
jgi:hypothetical protein